MDDLPGHLVAITSTCTMKLERFDEIGIRDKRSFENEFLEMTFQLLEEIINYSNEIGASNFQRNYGKLKLDAHLECPMRMNSWCFAKYFL